MKKEIKIKNDYIGDPVEAPNDEPWEDEPEVLPELKHKSRTKSISQRMKNSKIAKKDKKYINFNGK